MNIMITGANQGLGLSLVKVFTSYGHQVAAGLYPGDNSFPLTDFVTANPGQVTIVPMDVTDEDSVQAAALKIRERFGTLDLVVSNAVSSSGALFPAYSISKTAANKAVFILRATAGDWCKIYALHPGRMNTEMGRTTAQIEPEEAAEGIRVVAGNETGFINYKGEPMPL